MQTHSVFPKCTGPYFHAGCLHFWNIIDANKARPEGTAELCASNKIPIAGNKSALCVLQR